MTTRTVATFHTSVEEEELFPPEAEQLPLIAGAGRTYGGDCLACGLSSRFPLSCPQVCELCAEDVGAARVRIARLREANQRRLVDAETAYQQAMAQAGPAEHARLKVIELLRGAAPGSAAARAQLHAYLTDPARFGEGWAALLQAANARVATLYIVQISLSRCDRADAALDALGAVR